MSFEQTKARMQEIANRGIQDRLPEDKKAIFDEAVRRGIISLPEAKSTENIAVNTGQMAPGTRVGADQVVPKARDGSFMQGFDEGFLSFPGANVLVELAAAGNRSILDIIDFLGVDTINAFKDNKMPKARDFLGAEKGSFMKDDSLARDIVNTTGELAPAALGVGQVLRSAAGQLPKMTAASESAAAGTLRQLGSSKPAQDLTAAGLSAAGQEIGREVGGEDGALVGSVVAPIAGPALVAGAKEGVKQVGRGFGREQVAKAVDDFAEIGASPTLGQATGSEARQAIETRSSQVFGGGAIRKSLDDTTAKMQQRLKTIADDISGVRGDIEAGRAIQKGITGSDGFVARFQSKSGELWKKFDSLIDPTANVRATNTKETLDSLVNESEVGKIFNNPIVAKVRDALNSTDGQIDYKTFRELRSSIGAKLGSKDLISDIPRAELKQLYGALSQDLKEVAAQGGNQAVAALSRANSYTSAGHKRLDDFVERVAKKVDLDKVFQAMARGGDGVQSLNAMKRSLKPSEWEAVSANVIRKLGEATNGQQDSIGDVFSVPKFLTDWNKLGEAKKVLFSGSPKLNEYSKNLDKIARVADRVKESLKEGANPSGTGQLVANVSLGSGTAFAAVTGNWPALGGILATIGANKGLSSLMTNPSFVKWLAQATTTKDFPAHLARLGTVAQGAGFTEEAAELLESLRSMSQETFQPQ